MAIERQVAMCCLEHPESPPLRESTFRAKATSAWHGVVAPVRIAAGRVPLRDPRSRWMKLTMSVLALSYTDRDPVCRLSWVFVFPHADDLPAGVTQALVSVHVALLVAVDFRRPELCVRSSSLPVVLRTAVPETPVHEDRDFDPGKHQVSCSSNRRQRARGHSVAQTEGVHRRPQRELRTSIPTTVRAHHRPRTRTGCP